MTTDHIPPEYRVLEHVAQRLLGVPPRETLAALLDQPGFSWGELLEQGVRHRFLPALSHTLESDGLGKRAPKKVRDALNDLRYLARKRAAVFQQTSLALAGAVVASLLLGVAQAMAAAYLPAGLADILIFATLFVVLIFKPNGLFGGSVAPAGVGRQ